METSLQELWNSINEAVLIYGLKVLGALITLIIGSWVIKKLVKTFGKTLTKKGVDPTLIPTLKGVVKVALWAALILAFVKQVGIETSGFIAVFGAAGLAIGLALQGSLSNFAGGILILTIKPFKAGDFVEVNGQSGTVNSVTIFNTVLKTPITKPFSCPTELWPGPTLPILLWSPKEDGIRFLVLVMTMISIRPSKSF